MILILNEALDEALREQLDRDANAQDVTLNDAAGLILAAHYKLRWPLSDASYRPSTAARFKLRVPEAMHRKIRLDAARDQSTARGIVLNILSIHYGLEPVARHRRPRRMPA